MEAEEESASDEGHFPDQAAAVQASLSMPTPSIARSSSSISWSTSFSSSSSPVAEVAIGYRFGAPAHEVIYRRLVDDYQAEHGKEPSRGVSSQLYSEAQILHERSRLHVPDRRVRRQTNHPGYVSQSQEY